MRQTASQGCGDAGSGRRLARQTAVTHLFAPSRPEAGKVQSRDQPSTEGLTSKQTVAEQLSPASASGGFRSANTLLLPFRL